MNLQKDASLRYLLTVSLLTTLKESSSTEGKLELLKGYVGKLKPLLYDQASAKEKEERDVIGECIGRLASLDQEMLTEILEKVSNQNNDPNARTTFAIALYHAIQATTGTVPLQMCGVSDSLFTCLQKESYEMCKCQLMSCLLLLLTTKA